MSDIADGVFRAGDTYTLYNDLDMAGMVGGEGKVIFFTVWLPKPIMAKSAKVTSSTHKITYRLSSAGIVRTYTDADTSIAINKCLGNVLRLALAKNDDSVFDELTLGQALIVINQAPVTFTFTD